MHNLYEYRPTGDLFVGCKLGDVFMVFSPVFGIKYVSLEDSYLFEFLGPA